MVALRLFIAIETPPEVRALALEIIRRLRAASADAGWEKPEKMHCTLKFLGPTSEAVLPGIAGALRGIAGGQPPFRVRYRGLGCFPDRRRPRVIWAGMENDDGVLDGLYRAIEEGMAGFGYAREARAFRPHLTLGRIRSPLHSGKLIEILETLTLRTDTFPVAEIRLMSSETRPSGSVYAVREAFALVGNRPHGE